MIRIFYCKAERFIRVVDKNFTGKEYVQDFIDSKYTVTKGQIRIMSVGDNTPYLTVPTCNTTIKFVSTLQDNGIKKGVVNAPTNEKINSIDT